MSENAESCHDKNQVKIMNSSHIDFETLIHFTNQFEKSPKAIVSKLIWRSDHVTHIDYVTYYVRHNMDHIALIDSNFFDF